MSRGAQSSPASNRSRLGRGGASTCRRLDASLATTFRARTLLVAIIAFLFSCLPIALGPHAFHQLGRVERAGQAKETARVTKEMIAAYYGRGPEHSYFRGCSTGGRQAMMESQRYPDDFDGIISACPDVKPAASTLLKVWVSRVNAGPDGENLVAPADIPLIAEAVYDACDSLDGLEDGLISDPRTCRFDPATLLCKDGSDGRLFDAGTKLMCWARCMKAGRIRRAGS